MADSIKVSFNGSLGEPLAARLDRPSGKPRGWAIFAHCFTCSKDITAARNVAAELSRLGIAVLRFDFTGLGASDGEFANTNFSSNVQDLVLAAEHMRQSYEAPSILIGHSLGGAAVLAAASQIDGIKAVATIGAPSSAEHVIHNFGAARSEIEAKGVAKVELAGRTFTIKKQFLDDVAEDAFKECLANLKASLLVLHSPIDATVGIENASDIFLAAKHPKSFVSLDNADHLLSKPADSTYASQIIAAFCSKFLLPDELQESKKIENVVVSETGQGKFQNVVAAGQHRSFADEPISVGGTDTGPSPYDLLSAALGACTSMTLRMYADRKALDVGRISVEVKHAKIHMSDCESCTEEQQQSGGRIDQLERVLSFEGGLDPALHAKMLEIADKCPVHRTLESSSVVKTSIIDAV